jgi:hypothetical protein
LLDESLDASQFRGHLGRESLVFGRHLDHDRQVFSGRGGFFERFEDGFERLELTHDLLSPLLIFPKARSGHLLLKLGDLIPLAGLVKESP